MEATLQAHVNLCDEVYSLILEENQILKETNKAPEDSFLEKKRVILTQLDESIRNLRAVNSSTSPKARQPRPLIEKAQQIVLKTLLLDRENEQLLLKCAGTTPRPPSSLKPSANHLQRIYGKHRL